MEYHACFKKIISEEWKNIKDETCQKKEGFEERLNAVKKARGAHTKY